MEHINIMISMLHDNDIHVYSGKIKFAFPKLENVLIGN